MKIVLGTTSKQKMTYLMEVLSKIGIDADIYSADVASGISEQPIDSMETKQGSINRAKSALESNSLADLAMGVEFGYHPKKDGDYRMLCWVTIVDRDGVIKSASSHRITLPKAHQEILRSGDSMCRNVERLIEVADDKVVANISRDIDDRKDIIKTAIQTVSYEYWILKHRL